ncbi:hypothetical protein HDU84_006090 [Entophlyctis sp. JEL0112]|nr:hypothetical protein HDU84_006090 [Entophlyctis sp. JEL0112]
MHGDATDLSALSQVAEQWRAAVTAAVHEPAPPGAHNASDVSDALDAAALVPSPALVASRAFGDTLRSLLAASNPAIAKQVVDAVTSVQPIIIPHLRHEPNVALWLECISFIVEPVFAVARPVNASLFFSTLAASLFDTLFGPVLLPVLVAAQSSKRSSEFVIRITSLLLRSTFVSTKSAHLDLTWDQLLSKASQGMTYVFHVDFGAIDSRCRNILSKEQQRDFCSFLAEKIRADLKNRPFIILLILNVVSSNFSRFDSAALAESDLLRSLIDVGKTNLNPVVMAANSSIITLLVPVIRQSLTETDLLHLLDHLFRAIHWEIIMNAVFRVVAKAGPRIKDFLSDTEQSSMDMDFLIQMQDLEMSDEFLGGSSLMRSLLSEYSGRTQSSTESCDVMKSSNDIADLVVSEISSLGLRRSVDSTFTVLFALFPHFVMDMLRDRLASFSPISGGSKSAINFDTSEIVSDLGHEADLFRAVFVKLIQSDVLDETLLLKRRVSNLVKGHRMHPDFLFTTKAVELENTRQSTSRRPSEVLMDCILMRSDGEMRLSETQGLLGPLRQLADKLGSANSAGVTNSGIDFGMMHIASIFLRKTPFDEMSAYRALSTYNSTILKGFSSSELSETHMLLLICELNYELCVRNACIDEIMKLRKELLVQSVTLADHETIYLKFRAQQQEISKLSDALKESAAIFAKSRDSSRNYEEDLTRRLRATREAARESSLAAAAASESAAAAEHEVEALRVALAAANSRTQALELELRLQEPDLAKLAEFEETVKTLTNKIMSREQESNTHFELLERIEVLNGQISGLQLQLSSTNEQIDSFKVRIRELEVALDAKRDFCDPSVTEKAVNILREANAARIKAVDEKYRVLKQINAALETRIFELEALTAD